MSLRKREGWQKVRNRGPPRQCPAALAGLAQVINGDTLDIGTVWAGLHVIDAPESGRRSGRRVSGYSLRVGPRNPSPPGATEKRHLPRRAAAREQESGFEVAGPEKHLTTLLSARNLLYTGVTSGKRLVVLVGQKKAVAIAVRNAS